jgi:hypothetical protein
VGVNMQTDLFGSTYLDINKIVKDPITNSVYDVQNDNITYDIKKIIHSGIEFHLQWIVGSLNNIVYEQLRIRGDYYGERT